MANLSETEIKDQLYTSLLGAADDAKLLGILPAQGPTYARLRERLKVAETCCRQMGAYREDARWFGMGLKLEEAHQRTLRWVTGHSPRSIFWLLSEKLGEMARTVKQLETRKTRRVGMILPGYTVH